MFYILGLVMLGYIMLTICSNVIVCKTLVAESMVWLIVRGAIMIVIN